MIKSLKFTLNPRLFFHQVAFLVPDQNPPTRHWSLGYGFAGVQKVLPRPRPQKNPGPNPAGQVYPWQSLLETLLTLHFYHIRKDPATKRTSYLKSQSTIIYIPILTLFLLLLWCTFNFHMRYSSIVCHALHALDT